MSARSQELAAEIARLATARGITVAAAESLTGGGVSVALAAAPDASQWYAGSVTSYRSATKFRVLGVPEGPVITAACARAMASGVRTLVDADVAVALTGVGGPGEEEGHPPGTVYIAAEYRGAGDAREFHFDGEPGEVVEQAVVAALDLLLAALRRA